MAVFVIWECRFTEEGAGAEVTRRIWSDMRDFEDLDEPGHLLIVGKPLSTTGTERSQP